MPEELRKRRQKMGLTQGELATRLGVHRITVTRWETGASPIERPAMLRVMLQHLDDELVASRHASSSPPP